MEDTKKNFVLLSRVAKEKKYAQEYLGLLARRGDLGSIRIGKRWYTTREWFFEFEKDIAEKKAEAAMPEVEIEPVKEKEKIAAPVPLRIEKKLPTIDLRELAKVGIQKTERKNREATEGFEIRNEARVLPAGRHGFSPSFLPEPVEKSPLLPRFAFGASLVLLLALLFQAGWIYRNGLKKLARLDLARLVSFESGIVAGAYESKVGLSLVKNSSLNFLDNKADKVKEKVSFARVILRAAMERENQGDWGEKEN